MAKTLTPSSSTNKQEYLTKLGTAMYSSSNAVRAFEISSSSKALSYTTTTSVKGKTDNK